tara:strand:- start:61 stop:570 length:510 start_codon:yes stop_codon:yes gene_type:complete
MAALLTSARNLIQPSAMSEQVRPSWHEYFMTITAQVAQRSTCLRAKVGAVMVRDRSILATGYNGAPAGMPHCTDGGCLVYQSTTPTGDVEENCFRTIHAEINAIAQAARNGTRIDGADIYVTHTPCIHCFKVIVNSGIRRVFYARAYKLETIAELMERTSIELIEVGEG